MSLEIESTGPVSDPTTILGDLQDRSAAAALLASSGRVAVGSLPRMPTFASAQSFVRGVSLSRAGDIFGSLPHFQEAYAAGVPVIASALGALPEKVQDERSGLLFAPGDVAGLAGVLRRTCSHPALLRQLRAQLPQPSSMVAHAERIEQLYIDLVHEA